MATTSGPTLTLHDGGASGHGARPPMTGEQVMREGARILGAYLMRQLARLPLDDPDYDDVAADASRFVALGQR